ncbi:YrdB family protein [Paenibacillus sp. KQZ6P-2]|uniref:YrdB family protein n=1 Tax=Paenibacillus mangrovi TaxID=2931978 RepID=A0A9X1WL03_9BACL|nr:YrdB family protein [Paenibacillus mangrovi]MCJ8010824.1 YrdB family protein [Paenibacillus mangrovi]
MLNLLLRFILELVLLSSLCYFGFHVQTGLLMQFVLGLGLPVLAAFVWGLFVSPKASIKVPLPVVLFIEAVLFAAAVVCLISSGFTTFAVIFALLSVINRIVILMWKQQSFVN